MKDCILALSPSLTVRSLGVVEVVRGGVVNDLALGLDDQRAPIYVQLEVLHAREVHVSDTGEK